MFGIKQKNICLHWKNNHMSWWTIHVIGLDLREGTFAKMVTTLVIHHEDSTVVITLPFQIFAEHISIHEINCKIDKFVWKNRRVSKFRGEFPLPFSILINIISYKNSWSYQRFYYMCRVFKMILEWYERFWNKVELYI